MKVRLNVASGRDFSVFVYGQVNKPGKVVINNNSSIIDALGAAGGVKKTGTLRNISYTSNKKREAIASLFLTSLRPVRCVEWRAAAIGE